jgi:alpha-glucoside transport system substrate-binding protein
VRSAWEHFGQIAFSEGYVSEPPERMNLAVASNAMFLEPPGCWLYQSGSFAPYMFPMDVFPDQYSVFTFPTLEPEHASAMIGAGEFAMVLGDRPEVREFVRWMFSPEFGVGWAEHPANIVVLPNTRFDLDNYEADAMRIQAEAVRAALLDGTLRFDGSDLMPGAVGSLDEQGAVGSFWTGIVDYLRQGPESLDEILARIEESWPEE